MEWDWFEEGACRAAKASFDDAPDDPAIIAEYECCEAQRIPERKKPARAAPDRLVYRDRLTPVDHSDGLGKARASNADTEAERRTAKISEFTPVYLGHIARLKALSTAIASIILATSGASRIW